MPTYTRITVEVRGLQRVGCAYNVVKYSALKKAGLLYKTPCFLCGRSCWIYAGQKFRVLEVGSWT